MCMLRCGMVFKGAPEGGVAGSYGVFSKLQAKVKSSGGGAEKESFSAEVGWVKARWAACSIWRVGLKGRVRSRLRLP